MLNLQFQPHQLGPNAAFSTSSTQTLVVATTAVVAGTLFISMGIYGLYMNASIWGSYVVIGVGAATILSTLCFVAAKLVRSSSSQRSLVEDNSNTSPALPKRKVTLLTYISQPDSAILNLPDEVLVLILQKISSNDGDIESYKTLYNTSVTCKKLFTFINTEDISKDLLDRVSRIHSEFFKSFGSMEAFFPKKIRDTIFLTDEIYDDSDLYFNSHSGFPKNPEIWDAWTASKRVAVAGGINRHNQRFFAVRLKVIDFSHTKSYEGVIVFFEAMNSPDLWAVKELFTSGLDLLSLINGNSSYPYFKIRMFDRWFPTLLEFQNVKISLQRGREIGVCLLGESISYSKPKNIPLQPPPTTNISERVLSRLPF